MPSESYFSAGEDLKPEQDKDQIKYFSSCPFQGGSAERRLEKEGRDWHQKDINRQKY